MNRIVKIHRNRKNLQGLLHNLDPVKARAIASVVDQLVTDVTLATTDTFNIETKRAIGALKTIKKLSD